MHPWYDAGMAGVASRKCRIVKRVVTVVVAVLLLPVSYATSVASLYFADGANILPLPDPAFDEAIDAYSYPLRLYAYGSDWPGARTCGRLIWESADAGVRISGRGSLHDLYRQSMVIPAVQPPDED